jgi:hypothetical protein
VFHRDHDHSGEDLSRRIDHVMAAVLVGDERERREQLRDHLAPGFVYVGPDAVFEGVDGLSEAFALYRREDRRGTALRRTSQVDAHHDYFRFTWARVEHGRTAMEGWAFGSLDDRGALLRLVVFEGLEPGARADDGV